MKKILIIPIMFLLLISVYACQNKEPLFISKCFETGSVDNNAIELYNNSEKNISLSGYSIIIYQDGKKDSLKTINLEGEIKTKGFFLITNLYADEEKIVNNSDLKNENLLFTGNDPIALVKGKKTIDLIGYIGTDEDFAAMTTLVRKKDKQNAYKKFDSYNFIDYEIKAFDIIKTNTYEINEEELLSGPRLTDDMKKAPFKSLANAKLGGGGAEEVTLASKGDGDTTRFNFPQRNADGSLKLDGNGQVMIENKSVRYLFINTREVSGPYTDEAEWGYYSSKYNNKILDEAAVKGAKFYVQSLPGYAVIDSTSSDRYLGLVWIELEGKQTLLNFEMVKRGLSEISKINGSSLSYGEISFYGYLKNAERRAKNLKIGWFGEKDPFWNYDTLKPLIPRPNVEIK